MSELEQLQELGLTRPEAVATRLVLGVWRSIDWSTPLWKSAGAALYERLENRIRYAAHQTTLKDFVVKLQRQCHVSGLGLDGDAMRDLAGLSSGEEREALESLRRRSGLIVSALRVLQQERKERRNERDKRSGKQQADKPDYSAGLEGAGADLPFE